MEKETIYNLLPEKYRKIIEKEAIYANMDNYQSLALICIALISILFILLCIFLKWNILVRVSLLLGGLTISFFVPYLMITLAAEKRKTEIEQVLPDALMLMSANIKSGLTVDKAFLLSARDEFGPLAKEIKTVAMQIFGGVPIAKALTNLKLRIKSDIFSEIITLLIDGITSGGELSKLLESSAKDIRKTMLLRKEIAASVRMYILFITMASLIGAPLLFAISTYLTSTTSQIWGSSSIDLSSATSYGFFQFTKPEFNPEFFRIFSMVAIVITNFAAAFIISEIKYGTIKKGFKSAPIFVITALSIFFLVRYVISHALASLI